MSEVVDKVYNHVIENGDERIVLLKNKQVIQWLYDDTSFLPEVNGRTAEERRIRNKNNEDSWGREVMRRRRPDLRLEGQWTNKFGEHLCEEMYSLLGKQCYNPIIIHSLHPDLETDDSIIESKIQTHFTTGTAHEKIAGVAFKYADVSDIYGKPLIIVCMGDAEKRCRKDGIFGGQNCTPKRQLLINFCRDVLEITFVGATDLLNQIIAV